MTTGGWWDEPTVVLLPGRPDGVDHLSTTLRATGDSIATQVVRLRAVNADIWKGEAAARFGEHIKSTPGQLDLLATRYRGVAGALTGYADDLRAAQTKIAQAKERARQAAAEHAAASQALADARAASSAAERAAQAQPPDQPPLTPTLAPLGPLTARVGDAAEAMDDAERLRAEAERDRDGAAGRCAKTIGGCVSDDLKNQGGFFGWVKHTFKKVAPVLAAVAAIAGIAALFIPGLNLLALGLAVACLVVDSANYFVFHQGDLLTVALDLVGVAAFAGAIKAARAARAAQTTSTSARATQATKAGTTLKGASPGIRLSGAGRSVSSPTGAAFTRTAPRGGAGPVRQGAAGVERAIAKFEADGGRVLGREITLEAGGVRTRPDFFGELRNGQQVFVEVKTGSTAPLTANQRVAYPAVRTQGATPRGANAAAAGLTPGAPMGPTRVIEVRYPWPLP